MIKDLFVHVNSTDEYALELIGLDGPIVRYQ